MQFTYLVTLTTLFFTGLVAAVPGAVSMREPSADLEELLLERGTNHCANIAKVKRPARCTPERSKGWASSHNCANEGGKAYLCVQGGQSFCLTSKSQMKSMKYENGECFH
ncbi:hypothetical protein CPC08DRAFT_722410 [Agrocybe pediades]|nr:hypothetical protein CPC08DRAFT_722410 [Agrocybe pediades]